MKRILTAVVLIPLVLLAVFKAPSWLFTLLVGAVALLALKEYLDLVEGYGVKPIRKISYLYVATSFVFLAMFTYEKWYWWTRFSPFLRWIPEVSGLLILASPLIYLAASLRSEDVNKAFPAALFSWFGPLYVGLPMLALTKMRGDVLSRDGAFSVVFTFIAVWAGDTVAMYTGKTIGRHKLAPRVSPNKTWEGAIGSVVGSVIFCLLFWHFEKRFHPPEPIPYGGAIAFFSLRQMLVAAVLINIAAQIGDLAESVIKRGAGVKDSGALLPGHGGILDRIDALLLAAPVAFIIFASFVVAIA